VASEVVAVILGARGTLGLALGAELPRAGYRVAAAPGHGECDIRDAAALGALFAAAKPDVVFNAAAYTDVDRAESEPELASAVNAAGAENVARAAAAVGASVVHYSTDFVFDGELERPYVETDPPSPLGAYAETKVDGDARVAAANPRHFILRVGCLYGRGGRNFPSTIVRRLRAGERLRADRDRLGSPTWVRETAAVSAKLALTDHHGLYHATAHGETSWANFAQVAASILGVPSDRVEGVSSATLALKARRPRRAILDNRALRDRGLDLFSDWQDALRAFIAQEAEARVG
jgi:dTDP-4-dehydrorhamnose reductase